MSRKTQSTQGTDSTTTSGLSVSRSPVSLTSLIVGAAFLLVGVLGFVPGVTTNYGALGGAGHHSGAMLLGVFQVSVLHNLLHLAFGVLGVALSRVPSLAKAFLVVGGVAYLGLWVYGLVTADDSTANFVPVNAADDWLHLGLGLGMLVLGLVMPRRASRGTAATYHGPTAGGRIQ
ncbi:DUF4383 domain-containing protein [Kineococcus sp. SYSU DK001]|uniref:DUF4383 domain-containing protein n=1 Tax=Kineococcus sp. SYSU DK001 TaxID=3383122 RepID=UPI003D7EB1E7